MVGWIIVCGDQHIVHVDNEPSFVDLVLEDGVHHHLEGGWGIRQAEEHDCWFEQSFIGNKGCFPFVSLSNADVIIPPPYVELGKQSSGASFVYKLGNQREGVRVSNRPLVQPSIILNRLEFSILFLDEEEGCGIRTFGRADITLS